MLKHFLWSLLGIADLDPLDSVDSPSVMLAYFLYGVFLIMAVILLINMMIALLSNTYQQVAVRTEVRCIQEVVWPIASLRYSCRESVWLYSSCWTGCSFYRHS